VVFFTQKAMLYDLSSLPVLTIVKLLCSALCWTLLPHTLLQARPVEDKPPINRVCFYQRHVNDALPAPMPVGKSFSRTDRHIKLNK
jgi:hypothetical protein